MSVSMQGISFHAFAAVMTFTVLAFPTPTDLVDRIKAQFSDSKVTEIKSFPTIEGHNPPLNSVIDAKEFVPVISACVVGEEAGFRSADRACSVALTELAEATGDVQIAERITQDKQAVELATSFYCRAKWAESYRFGRFFDVYDCMGSNDPLAQPLD